MLVPAPHGLLKNMVLGHEKLICGALRSARSSESRSKVSDQFNFDVNSMTPLKVYLLGVQQRVEIIRALISTRQKSLFSMNLQRSLLRRRLMMISPKIMQELKADGNPL
jgi:ABC-type uncharacterized transport system ATPase subunit